MDRDTASRFRVLQRVSKKSGHAEAVNDVLSVPKMNLPIKRTRERRSRLRLDLDHHSRVRI